MSKLEEQKALPRRKLFSKPETTTQIFGKDVSAQLTAHLQRQRVARKAKKAKRKS